LKENRTHSKIRYGHTAEIQDLRDTMRSWKESNVKPKDKPTDSATEAQNNAAEFTWVKPDSTTSAARTRVGVRDGEERERFDAEKLTEGSVCVVAG
jgi:hypothetical protein